MAESDGFAVSVMMPAAAHYEDPTWYDQAGQDPFDREKIMERPAGAERKAVLQDLCDRLPKYGPKMYEKAAAVGDVALLLELVAVGAEWNVKKVRGDDGDVDEDVEDEEDSGSDDDDAGGKEEDEDGSDYDDFSDSSDEDSEEEDDQDNEALEDGGLDHSVSNPTANEDEWEDVDASSDASDPDDMDTASDIDGPGQSGNEEDVDDDEDDDTPMVDMDPAAHTAAFCGHLQFLQVLFDALPIDINARDENGSTALTNALVAGHAHIAKWLLSRGATVISAKRSGVDDLQAALKSGSTETLDVLRSSAVWESHGRTFKCEDLVYAAASGNADLVSSVLETIPFVHAMDPSNHKVDAAEMKKQERELVGSLCQATARGSTSAVDVLLGYLTQEGDDGAWKPLRVSRMSQKNLFDALDESLERGDEPALFEVVLETVLVCAPTAGTARDVAAVTTSEPTELMDTADDEATVLSKWGLWRARRVNRLLRHAQRKSRPRPRTAALLSSKYGAKGRSP